MANRIVDSERAKYTRAAVLRFESKKSTIEVSIKGFRRSTTPAHARGYHTGDGWGSVRRVRAIAQERDVHFIMKQCYKCGAVLPAGAQDVCFTCGAIQPKDAPEEAPAHNRAPAPAQRAAAAQKKKSDRTLRVLVVIAAVLAALLLAACVATYFMYNTYNADKTLSALSTALLAGDTQTLRTLVEGDGISVTQEGLEALCRTFSSQDKIDALLTQLRAELAPASASASASAAADGGAVPYPALSLGRRPVFLGYASYSLRAKPVSLLVPVGPQNPLLTINGATVTGESSERGVLYDGLFPGEYTCQLSAQTLMGVTLGGPEKNVALFDAENALAFDGELPISDVTVAGVPNDAAVITVDGAEVAQKAAGGTVSLPQVGVGSTIAFSYTADYGAVTTGSVVFAVRGTPALSFANVVTEGGVPTEQDLTTILGAYYASYLDALNVQDAARILNCTELLRSAETASLSSASNKASLFEFGSAVVSMSSLAQGTDGELPSLTLNAAFRYTVTGRESHESAEKTSYYTCQLVFQNGAWCMNRIKATTQSAYEAATLQSFDA